MTEESQYYETSIKLAHNDTLLLFTDGAYEIFNDNNKMLGDEKLKSIFLKNMHKNINVIKENMIKELKNFSNNSLPDDISMIFLRRTD